MSFLVSKVKLPYRKGKHAEKEIPMLFRNMQNLYNTDSTEGTTTTTQADTQQQQNGNEEKPKLFTQEELSKVAAKEAREAKAKAEKAMLERFEKLGAKSFEEIEALLSTQREKQEAEKTEAQKLQDALNLAKQENAAFQQKLLEAEKSRRIEKRDSELKALLSKAHDEKQVLILLKALHGEKLDSLLDENGNFDNEEAQRLVSDYQKANPFMFKDSSPGSAMSNKDGTAPTANEEARKALSEMVGKATKGF